MFCVNDHANNFFKKVEKKLEKREQLSLQITSKEIICSTILNFYQQTPPEYQTKWIRILSLTFHDDREKIRDAKYPFLLKALKEENYQFFLNNIKEIDGIDKIDKDNPSLAAIFTQYFTIFESDSIFFNLDDLFNAKKNYQIISVATRILITIPLMYFIDMIKDISSLITLSFNRKEKDKTHQNFLKKELTNKAKIFLFTLGIGVVVVPIMLVLIIVLISMELFSLTKTFLKNLFQKEKQPSNTSPFEKTSEKPLSIELDSNPHHFSSIIQTPPKRAPSPITESTTTFSPP